MYKFLLAAFLLQLIFTNETKLQSPLQEESSSGRISLFLRERLIRQEHQEKDIEKMKEKWQKIFHTDDLNDDRVITLAERDRRIHLFIDIHITYLVKTLRKSFHCAYFSFGGNESAIAIDEFLNGMENAYKTDSSALLKKFRTCNELYASFIDVNNDLRLSWQEYKDFVSRAYETDTDALRTDFLSWNPRISADEVVNAKNKNSDLEITWEEYKDFRSQSSEIAIDELKEDFLDLNPYISVEDVIDAWAAFEADDRGTNDQVQKEMANGMFVQPKESLNQKNKESLNQEQQREISKIQFL